MKPMNLMEAFGALPEEEVARALHPEADAADDADEQPVFKEMPAEPEMHRSPLRIAETIVASAASIAIVAGLIMLIGKIGRAPATPTSTADSNTAELTQTDQTDQTDKTELTVTTAAPVQISDDYPNAVHLFPKNNQACLWYDTDINPESKERPEVKVAAFPGTVFLRSENDEISMVQNGRETVLCGKDFKFNGGYVDFRARSAYFSDLNFDGYPELCMIGADADMTNENVAVIYDVHAQEQYIYSENCAAEYQFYLQNGVLCLKHQMPDSDGILEWRFGELAFIPIGHPTIAAQSKEYPMIFKWDTKQYVGEPLDLEGMTIQTRIVYSDTGAEIFTRYYASDHNFWHCWRLDTSAVDFTRHGTYNVYLCALDKDMNGQRAAFAVTLESRGETVVPGTTVTTDPAHSDDKTTPDPFSGVTTAGTKGTDSAGTTGANTTQSTVTTTETTPSVLNPTELFPKGNQACEWFGGSTKKADAPAQVRVAAFPDLVFTYSDHAGIGLLKNGKAAALQLDTDGLPTVPVNAYFCDLNYDGYPELCTTLFCGSGIIDARVAVCDLHNGKTYTLEDRGTTDYYLQPVSGVLYVYRYPYGALIMDSADLSTYPRGRLEICGGALKYYASPESLKTQQNYSTQLVVNEWKTRQFVGMPLDFSGLSLTAKASVADKYGQTEQVSAYVSPLDESLKQCWRVDTSGVDFTKPGTYTVYFESIANELGRFSYYTTGSTLEKRSFVGGVQPSRQAVQITLEQRSDVLSFTDEYGHTDVKSYTFNPIWIGYLKLENVWGADVTYEIGDSAVLEIDTPDTKYLNMGRTLRIALMGKKDGTTTLTVRTSDGRSKSIQITVKYVNDDLSGETTTD